MSGPKRSSASPRYFDHALASRTSVPRNGSRLCIVLVAFSARFSTRCFGRNRCISAGRLGCGVSWNTIGTPSIVCVSSGCVIEIVGASSERPAPRRHRSCRGRRPPSRARRAAARCRTDRRRAGSWRCRRRPISAITASMKPAGAMIAVRARGDIGRVDDAARAAVVVAVAVRVDDGETGRFGRCAK